MLGWRSRLGFIDITVKEQGFSMLIEIRSGNEGPVAGCPCTMRPRCAVPAGEPPGELAVDCACKCAAKKLPAARSRRKSAGAARPVCCASQHTAGCTHRCARLAGQQNAAQTADRANERYHGFFKVPRIMSCMVLSQLGRSKH